MVPANRFGVNKPGSDKGSISASVILRRHGLDDQELADLLSTGTHQDSLLFSYVAVEEGSDLTIRPDFKRYYQGLANVEHELLLSGFDGYTYVELPQVELRVFNHSDHPGYVKGIRLKVRANRSFREPFILVSDPFSDGCFGLEVQNAGSDFAENLSIKFGMAPENTPITELNFSGLPFSDALGPASSSVGARPTLMLPGGSPQATNQALEILGDTMLLHLGRSARFSDSIRREADGLLRQLRAGQFFTRDAFGKLQSLGKAMGFGTDSSAAPGYQLAALFYGEIRYTYGGAAHSLTFVKRVRQDVECQIGGPAEYPPEDFFYNALLSSNLRKGDEIQIPALHRVDSREMVRLALVFASMESADYEFDTYVDLEDGRSVHAGTINLRYFIPRVTSSEVNLVKTADGRSYLQVSVPETS
jgi:hypothetical protein